MNTKALKWLALAAVALLALMFAVDRADKSDTVAGGELLLPGLKEHLNEVNRVVVTGSGENNIVTILQTGDGWSVQEKSGFGADVGKLREVLLAIADARKLEQKTSNPERFAQLGLDGPDAGSGMLLDISGTDFDYALIVGNAAQSKNRYVRIADDDQSWLVDKNPEIAATAEGWLATDLLDIDASRIKSVVVQHDDSENISLAKESANDSNFVVADIPDGRELSYATVANGIAGVLKGLTLEDVRRESEGTPISTTVFTTFDGLVIRLRRYQDEVPSEGASEDNGDNAFWFAIDAEYLAPVEKPDAEKETGAEVADNVAIDDTAGDELVEEEDDSDNGSESTVATAADINAQHAGWQYKVPSYKANLIARRWNDILKAQEE